MMGQNSELTLNEQLSDEENAGDADHKREHDAAQDFLMGRFNDDDLGRFMGGGPGTQGSPTNNEYPRDGSDLNEGEEEIENAAGDLRQPVFDVYQNQKVKGHNQGQRRPASLSWKAQNQQKAAVDQGPDPSTPIPTKQNHSQSFGQ